MDKQDIVRLADELMEKIKIEDLFLKYFPNSYFIEEIAKNKTYLVTYCPGTENEYDVGTLYFAKDLNLYRCFDCGMLGGVIEFFDNYLKLEDAKRLELFASVVPEVGNLDEENIIELEEKLIDYAQHSDYIFDDADLATKAPYPDGSWKRVV